MVRSFMICTPRQILCVIKSRRMRWIWHVGKKRNVYKVFVGKPEEKRLLVRPRHRWKGNIKMDLKEMG